MKNNVRLSLHLMVKNGAVVLGRALRPLRGVVSEIVYVDTGSNDGTPEVIASLAREIGVPVVAGVAISPWSQADAFFEDRPSSFEHSLDGKYTGAKILRDWAWARNLGLDLCSGQYIMKLDADDEIMIPENILPTLDYLDLRPDIDIIMAPYEVMDGDQVAHTEMYSRIWRNLSSIRFREVCHENVDHVRRPDGTNWLMVPGGLLFRDWRDSPGDDVRPVNRNFKVLLHEYERLKREGQTPGRHLLLYLAEEGVEVVPELSMRLIGEIGEMTEDDKTWCQIIRARCLDRCGRAWESMEEYALAASRGHLRAALLLALLKCRIDVLGWRETLQVEIGRCQRSMYPYGASHREIAMARRLLEGLPATPDVLVDSTV